MLVSIASAPHPPYPLFSTWRPTTQWTRFNRICAPSTLSTKLLCCVASEEDMFQSHLRPIHPIHLLYHPPDSFPLQQFQSHLRPIHPIHLRQYAEYQERAKSFNRICAPSTLSTCHLLTLHCDQMLFQSHLRPIHPIHTATFRHFTNHVLVSIASAPHPPYPQRGASHGPGSGFRLCFSRQMALLPHFCPVCLFLEEYSASFSLFQAALEALRGSFA